MDIKHLQYFVSIVDHGGYSPAARSLFITQPTLSQTIKKLESELHTPLFNQLNGCWPTPIRRCEKNYFTVRRNCSKNSKAKSPAKRNDSNRSPNSFCH